MFEKDCSVACALIEELSFRVQMRESHRHQQAVRAKRSKNQCLGWELNPDRQICALMLCRLSYRDPQLNHIIQPCFHLTVNSVVTATSPAVAIQTQHGYPRQILAKRLFCPESCLVDKDTLAVTRRMRSIIERNRSRGED